MEHHLPLLVVAGALDDTAGERGVVVVAVLERAMQGDEREAREQAEDHVAGAAVGVRVAEDLLDAGDVMAVLRLLDLVHGDRDGLHDGARQLEADLRVEDHNAYSGRLGHPYRPGSGQAFRATWAHRSGATG